MSFTSSSLRRYSTSFFSKVVLLLTLVLLILRFTRLEVSSENLPSSLWSEVFLDYLLIINRFFASPSKWSCLRRLVSNWCLARILSFIGICSWNFFKYWSLNISLRNIVFSDSGCRCFSSISAVSASFIRCLSERCANIYKMNNFSRCSGCSFNCFSLTVLCNMACWFITGIAVESTSRNAFSSNVLFKKGALYFRLRCTAFNLLAYWMNSLRGSATLWSSDVWSSPSSFWRRWSYSAFNFFEARQ